MKCAFCNKEINHEFHCMEYGTDGPEPPFYCSDKCYGKISKYKDIIFYLIMAFIIGITLSVIIFIISTVL